MKNLTFTLISLTLLVFSSTGYSQIIYKKPKMGIVKKTAIGTAVVGGAIIYLKNQQDHTNNEEKKILQPEKNISETTKLNNYKNNKANQPNTAKDITNTDNLTKEVNHNNYLPNNIKPNDKSNSTTNDNKSPNNIQNTTESLLEKNMYSIGKGKKPKNHTAYYIVTNNSTNPLMLESLKILDNLNIDINDGENGVYLPNGLNFYNFDYAKSLYQQLYPVKNNKDEVKKVLNNIYTTLSKV